MNNPTSHTAPAKDSLQIALAHVQAFECNGGYPNRYRKEAMWEDLQALAQEVHTLRDKVGHLRRDNEKMRENLQRFAPGTPTVEEYGISKLRTNSRTGIRGADTDLRPKHVRIEQEV